MQSQNDCDAANVSSGSATQSASLTLTSEKEQRILLSCRGGEIAKDTSGETSTAQKEGEKGTLVRTGSEGLESFWEQGEVTAVGAADDANAEAQASNLRQLLAHEVPSNDGATDDAAFFRRFKIERSLPLGRGAFGEVLRGVDMQTLCSGGPRHVAIKEVQPKQYSSRRTCKQHINK